MLAADTELVSDHAPSPALEIEELRRCASTENGHLRRDSDYINSENNNLRGIVVDWTPFGRVSVGQQTNLGSNSMIEQFRDSPFFFEDMKEDYLSRFASDENLGEEERATRELLLEEPRNVGVQLTFQKVGRGRMEEAWQRLV